MQRRISLLLALLMLTLALTACGQRPAQTPTEQQTTEQQTTAAREAEGDIASPQAQTTPESQPGDAETPHVITPSEALAMDTNTGPLFQKFVREKVADGTYTLRTEQNGMKIVVSADGGDSAMESDAAGILHFSLVHKGGSYYMIMHTTKKYAQMSEQEYKKQADSFSTSAIDFSKMQFQSAGSETVGGKTYSTETYDEGEQGIVTYFFDETGVRRTRVVKDGKTNETDVFSVSADADAAMFDIPAGYTLVSEPAQLMG